MGRRLRLRPTTVSWVAAGTLLGCVLTVLVVGARVPENETFDVEQTAGGRALVTVPLERRHVTGGQVFRATPVVSSIELPSTLEGVVTKVPVTAGGAVENGRVVVEVNGRPLFALTGAFPLYREIRFGDRGPDVAQVQRAFVALRYSVPVDGMFGLETQQALGRLYREQGYDAPSGVDDPHAVSGAEEAVHQAQAALAAATEAVHRAERQAAAAEDDAVREEAAAEVDAARQQRAAAERMLHTAEASLSGLRNLAGPKVVPGEIWARNDLPLPVDGVNTTVGSTLPAEGKPFASTRGGAAVVSGTMRAGEGRRPQPGAAAVVVDDVAGREHEARVGAVDAAGEEAEVDEVVVRVELVDRGVALAPAQSYRVRIEGEASDGEVLAAPMTAVNERADGSAFVVVLAGPVPRRAAPPRTRTVDVEIGVDDGMWVELRPARGAALAPGDRVVVGSAGSSS